MKTFLLFFAYPSKEMVFSTLKTTFQPFTHTTLQETTGNLHVILFIKNGGDVENSTEQKDSQPLCITDTKNGGIKENVTEKMDQLSHVN